MEIVFPSDTKEIIDNIRKVIGRNVTFNYVASSYNCPVCKLDPVTNTSDNAFCVICSGNYHIDIISGYTTTAVVTWSPSERNDWGVGGTIAAGDCLIQVELTDTIKGILPKTKKIIVDNRILEIKKQMRRGVKALNRVLLSLMEVEKE